MKKIKYAFSGLAATALLLVGGLSFAPAIASAQSTTPTTITGPAQQICNGVILTGGNCDEEKQGEGVNGIIKTIINILSLAVGVIAVIMIIIGGMKYVLSSGDSGSVNSAKNTILFALVGLVVVALAQVLVRFVLTRVK